LERKNLGKKSQKTDINFGARKTLNDR